MEGQWAVLQQHWRLSRTCSVLQWMVQCPLPGPYSVMTSWQLGLELFFLLKQEHFHWDRAFLFLTQAITFICWRDKAVTHCEMSFSCFRRIIVRMRIMKTMKSHPSHLPTSLTLHSCTWWTTKLDITPCATACLQTAWYPPTPTRTWTCQPSWSPTCWVRTGISSPASYPRSVTFSSFYLPLKPFLYIVLWFDWDVIHLMGCLHRGWGLSLLLATPWCVALAGGARLPHGGRAFLLISRRTRSLPALASLSCLLAHRAVRWYLAKFQMMLL